MAKVGPTESRPQVAPQGHDPGATRDLPERRAPDLGGPLQRSAEQVRASQRQFARSAHESIPALRSTEPRVRETALRGLLNRANELGFTSDEVKSVIRGVYGHGRTNAQNFERDWRAMGLGKS